MSSMAHVLGFFIIACSQHPELEVPGNQGIPCVWMFRYIRLHKLTILLYISLEKNLFPKACSSILIRMKPTMPLLTGGFIRLHKHLLEACVVGIMFC